MKILDVGGSSYNWDIIKCQAHVTMLNLTVPENVSGYLPNYKFVKGDARELPYEDNSFDVAYSNSVIEHLHNYENQKKFATEIRRVGRGLWVQTPARCFFIEPHLIAPFIHYLPRVWQRRLLRNFTLWGLVTRPTQEQVNNFLDEVQLLNYSQMRELFPDCYIMKEKLLFFTKSYIAVRPALDHMSIPEPSFSVKQSRMTTS